MNPALYHHKTEVYRHINHRKQTTEHRRHKSRRKVLPTDERTRHDHDKYRTFDGRRFEQEQHIRDECAKRVLYEFEVARDYYDYRVVERGYAGRDY